jgi:hypothetical protein
LTKCDPHDYYSQKCQCNILGAIARNVDIGKNRGQSILDERILDFGLTSPLKKRLEVVAIFWSFSLVMERLET